jgi:hypothetical protein
MSSSIRIAFALQQLVRRRFTRGNCGLLGSNVADRRDVSQDDADEVDNALPRSALAVGAR